MNRMRKQMIKAKKGGLSALDVAKMRSIAQKEAQKVENQATEKAFLYMLAIPLNILVNDYWSKTAKRKAPKFIEEVINLYEAVQNGNVSEKELADLLEDMAGVKITADWLDKKGGVNERLDKEE